MKPGARQKVNELHSVISSRHHVGSAQGKGTKTAPSPAGSCALSIFQSCNGVSGHGKSDYLTDSEVQGRQSVFSNIAGRVG